MRSASWRTCAWAFVVSAMAFMSGSWSLEVVECDVDHVEVAQTRALRGGLRHGLAEDQRHDLFGEAAVRAQRHVETGEVVLDAPRAEHDVACRDHDEVAHARRRQFEARAALG